MKFYIDGSTKLRTSLVLSDDGKIVREVIPKSKSNNEAEWLAYILALKIAKPNSELHILSDSELLVKQLKGEYRIKKNNLIKLSAEAYVLEQEKNLAIKVEHIRRENNLAGKILDKEIRKK